MWKGLICIILDPHWIAKTRCGKIAIVQRADYVNKNKLTTDKYRMDGVNLIPGSNPTIL